MTPLSKETKRKKSIDIFRCFPFILFWEAEKTQAEKKEIKKTKSFTNNIGGEFSGRRELGSNDG